jgi:hypothetical protein
MKAQIWSIVAGVPLYGSIALLVLSAGLIEARVMSSRRSLPLLRLVGSIRRYAWWPQRGLFAILRSSRHRPH